MSSVTVGDNLWKGLIVFGVGLYPKKVFISRENNQRLPSIKHAKATAAATTVAITMAKSSIMNQITSMESLRI